MLRPSYARILTTPPVCPSCSNTLTVSRVTTTKITSLDASASKDDDTTTSQNCFVCLTCPYQYPLTKRFFERRLLKRKDVDDIVGGQAQWENANKTEVQCPNAARGLCDGREAFFYQLQIRSADEPMTSFFKVRVILFQLRRQIGQRY